MAKKSKPAKTKKQKKVDTSAITADRLRRVKGKSRSFEVIGAKKGEPKIISRRQAEKIIQRKPRANARIVKKKIEAYYALLDSYVQKQAEKGKPLSKKQARESEEMKKVVQDLKKASKLRKKGNKLAADKLTYDALKQTKRGDRVIWGDEGMVSISQATF